MLSPFAKPDAQLTTHLAGVKAFVAGIADWLGILERWGFYIPKPTCSQSGLFGFDVGLLCIGKV